MSDRPVCPHCAQGEISRGEGRLEQCGDTYLPTEVWSCAVCGWIRFEPAVGTRWRPAHPGPAMPALPAGAAPPPRRRAA
jgi:rubredoxin